MYSNLYNARSLTERYEPVDLETNEEYQRYGCIWAVCDDNQDELIFRYHRLTCIHLKLLGCIENISIYGVPKEKMDDYYHSDEKIDAFFNKYDIRIIEGLVKVMRLINDDITKLKKRIRDDSYFKELNSLKCVFKKQTDREYALRMKEHCERFMLNSREYVDYKANTLCIWNRYIRTVCYEICSSITTDYDILLVKEIMDLIKTVDKDIYNLYKKIRPRRSKRIAMKHET